MPFSLPPSSQSSNSNYLLIFFSLFLLFQENPKEVGPAIAGMNFSVLLNSHTVHFYFMTAFTLLCLRMASLTFSAILLEALSFCSPTLPIGNALYVMPQHLISCLFSIVGI